MRDCLVKLKILWNTVAGLYCRIMWEDNEAERRSDELNLGNRRLL